jgi:anti-sigma factor RsiW
MTHLGDRLSALIDGELDGAERDRAYAHLAGCERCRAEAADLRALKKKLRTLRTGAPAEAAIAGRLIAMAGPGGPPPPRRRLRAGLIPGPGARPAIARGPHRPPWPRSARRRRHLMIGGICLVVGLGTAAFTAGGGGTAEPGPRITPPMEMYSVEHAITTGEVPFAGPSGQRVQPASSASASATGAHTP